MYTKTLLPRYLTTTVDMETGSRAGTLHLRQAYRIADQLLMHDLQNALMDQIALCYKRNNSSFGPLSLKQVADELHTTPCYRFAIKSAVRNIMRNIRGEVWAEGMENFRDNPDVMRDIIKGVISWNVRSWSARCTEDLCEFHIHPDGQRCSKR